MAPASVPVDSRADRTTQWVIAVVLLAAFVFRQVWMIPVLGVLVGAGALFGPGGNPFHRLFVAFVAPRLSAPETFEDEASVRAQDVLITALLGAATIFMLISLNVIVWVIALAAAGAAAAAATTGVRFGVVVHDRLRRHKG